MCSPKRYQSLLIIILLISLLTACFPDKKAQDHQELMAFLQTRQVSGISPYEATRAFFMGEELEEAEVQDLVTTATPAPQPTGTPVPPPEIDTTDQWVYYAQSGDTVMAVARRFGVPPEQVVSTEYLPPKAMIPIGQLLVIPRKLEENTLSSDERFFPDSEVVFSVSAADFNVADYVYQAGGYLNSYGEYFKADEYLTGIEVIERISEGYSISPRLLLALLEFQGHWVYGSPEGIFYEYPLGYQNEDYRGLYLQLMWAAQRLSVGYYGWRDGSLVDITFKDGRSQRIDPGQNAGSAALMYLFSLLFDAGDWQAAIFGDERFSTISDLMFGDAVGYSAGMGPIFPDGTTQPVLDLPFLPGTRWNFTGGPHGGWGKFTPWSAIDFAPSGQSGCVQAEQVVLAAAEGVVVRTATGLLMLDLDGDGSEQTGWVLQYLHVSTADHPAVGTRIKKDDVLGHPSCEGGFSTGTHVHVARKFNGEWVAADGPVPFVLSGWQVEQGEKAYAGALLRADERVDSSTVGSGYSLIRRD
jgi:LasA protease